MLESAAGKITSLFIKKEIIKSDDYNIYAYGFELLLSTLVNTICVGLVALLTGTVWQTIVYMGTFIGIRSFAGGYHAETHFRCVSLMMVYYIAFLFLLNYMPDTWYIYFNSMAAVLSFILIFLKAPVVHENKPLSKEEITLYRKKARIIASVFLMAAILTAFWPGAEKLSICFSCGLATVGAALVMVSIRDGVRKKFKKS